MYIAPLDDKTKKRLLAAVANRGKASGLEAAAMLIGKLAENRMRVVGTREIKELAAAIAEKAAEIRATADGEIAAMESETRIER